MLTRSELLVEAALCFLAAAESEAPVEPVVPVPPVPTRARHPRGIIGARMRDAPKARLPLPAKARPLPRPPKGPPPTHLLGRPPVPPKPTAPPAVPSKARPLPRPPNGPPPLYMQSKGGKDRGSKTPCHKGKPCNRGKGQSEKAKPEDLTEGPAAATDAVAVAVGPLAKRARAAVTPDARATQTQQPRPMPPRPKESTARGAGHERSAGCVLVRRRDAAAAPSGDGVLEALVIRRGSRWAYELPKGHLEGAESWQQAAERELREETGLVTEVVLGPEVGQDMYMLKNGVPKTVKYFVCGCPRRSGPVRFGSGKEGQTKELLWTSFAELPRLSFRKHSHQAIVRLALQLAWSCE